jgi:RND family efflux transporter MFP subunit
MIPYLLLILITVPFISVGCSQNQEKKPPPPPIKVGAMNVDRGEIIQSLSLSGVMKFSANTTLSAEVAAQVETIDVEDGQFVKTGDLLLTLDRTKIKEAVEQASANLKKDEASLAFSKSELDRSKGLYDTGSVSYSAFDQKLTAYQNSLGQVEADRALLARASEDLKKTHVTAPISGVLSRRFIEKGDWVSEGKRLFQISDYQRIYLEAFMTDMEVGRLSVKKIRAKGEEALVTLDAYPGETFAGRLTYIEPVANDNRMFEVRIYVENTDMRLLQGMVGRARVAVKTIPDTVRVPMVALLDELRNKTDNTVFIVDREQRAQLTRVKLGEANHVYATVVAGLNPGDVVVVQGKEVLSSGQPLTISLLPNP